MKSKKENLKSAVAPPKSVRKERAAAQNEALKSWFKRGKNESD